MCFRMFHKSPYQTLPSQPNLDAAIASFLANFTYLTPDNKINESLLTRYFSNKESAEPVSKVAIELKSSLTNDNKLVLTEDDFINMIEKAIDDVQVIRKDGHYSRHYQFIQTGHNVSQKDGLSYRFEEEYYYSQRNGSFEKSIIQGITACKQYLSPETSNKALGLIDKIKHHHSEKIIIRKEIYLP